MPPDASRWRLIRDAVTFQVKLFLDGLMDVLLGPMTLVAAIVQIIAGKPGRDGPFYEILRQAHRVDRWINLFGAGEEPIDDFPALPQRRDDRVDTYFERVEDLLRDQHTQGGMTAAAKAKIDRWLDAIERESNRDPPT